MEKGRGSVTWNDFSGAPALRQHKVLFHFWILCFSKRNFMQLYFENDLATSKHSSLYWLLITNGAVSKEQNWEGRSVAWWHRLTYVLSWTCTSLQDRGKGVHPPTIPQSPLWSPAHRLSWMNTHSSGWLYGWHNGSSGRRSDTAIKWQKRSPRPHLSVEDCPLLGHACPHPWHLGALVQYLHDTSSFMILCGVMGPDTWKWWNDFLFKLEDFPFCQFLVIGLWT